METQLIPRLEQPAHLKTSSEVELMETNQYSAVVNDERNLKTSSEVELMETSRSLLARQKATPAQNFFGS